MTDDRSSERDLDRFWNDLVAGTTPADESRLDPRDAEAIRLFQEHATAPQPRSSHNRVRARIDAEVDRLEHRPNANGRVRFALPHSSSTLLASGRNPGPPLPATASPARGSRRRLSLIRFATAAAAVLVVVVAALSVWRDPRPASDDLARLPAFEPPTTTAIPGVTEQELIGAAIAAETLPAGRASASLNHLTLPPGIRTTGTFGRGVYLHYVFSGTLTVRIDGAARLLRGGGDGSWEPVPVNADLTLGAGDAVLFLDPANVAFANPGTTPAEVLGLGLWGEGAGDPFWTVPDWIVNDYAQAGKDYPIAGEGIVLPGRPAVLRLSRVVLDSGVSIPAAPVDRFRLVVAAPDNGLGTPTVPDLAMPPDGRIVNRGTTSNVVYGVTLEIPGAAGTPIAAEPEP